MAASKARKRSPHPGLVLLKPTGRRTSWRARFTDPDNGKLTFESLDPLALRTEAARRDWAISKAKQLARRKLELEGGAARKTGTPLREGIELFFTARKSLRGRTVENYRACMAEFVAWADGAGLTALDDVKRPSLLEFKDAVISAPHGTSKAKAHRSGYTVNRVLRGTSTVLRFLLERNKLPSCSSDDLKVGLKREQASIDRIDILGRSEPAALLRACLEHDGTTYRETRAEHRGEGKAGSTPRYECIAPFTLVLLLTGMRFSECIDLEWSQVDLGAVGHDGSAVGELYLRAHNVKTKRGREVTFDVSPSLRELLSVLKHGNGKGKVFGWLTRDALEAARKRLKTRAPAFSWQGLRRTSGSYLTNAPGIFGAAAAFHSAKRLGHSVAVAEKHYLGTVKGIPHEAKTLETAMGIEVEAQAVVEFARTRFGGKAAE
jgi:integrase